MLVFMLLAHPAALTSLAHAQSYEVHPDYTVEQWTTREGLPANTVIGLGQRQILQGADGYLWFTTIEGLVRFDGLSFTVFSAGDTPDLLSNRIIALVEALPGTLWLQDEQWNITCYHEGQFASINEGNTSGGYMKVLQDGATT